MLTLTYALVALSVEQKRVKTRLLELQQEVQIERQQRLRANQAHFELLVSQFIALDEACRLRSIELYVLPAIRAASSDADSMLADIDALTLMGRITLKTVRCRLRQAVNHGSFEMDYLCDSLQQYCQDMFKRLDLEETQILPLAQRVISSDEWFDIAARFISHDTERHGGKSFDSDEMVLGEEGAAFAVPHVAKVKRASGLPSHVKH
ncbi:MAG TPA: hypothetical protein VIF60_19410 [Burkholderiaceae bacterium]|jgi:hypothetical protein